METFIAFEAGEREVNIGRKLRHNRWQKRTPVADEKIKTLQNLIRC